MRTAPLAHRAERSPALKHSTNFGSAHRARRFRIPNYRHRRHYLRATRPRLHSALWPSQFGFDLKDLTAEEEGKEEEEETTGMPKEAE